MVVVTRYEVWSEGIAPKRERKLEGTYPQWNAPGTKNGAVQAFDRLSNDFYKEFCKSKAHVLVTIKEVQSADDQKEVVVE